MQRPYVVTENRHWNFPILITGDDSQDYFGVLMKNSHFMGNSESQVHQNFMDLQCGRKHVVKQEECAHWSGEITTQSASV